MGIADIRSDLEEIKNRLGGTDSQYNLLFCDFKPDRGEDWCWTRIIHLVSDFEVKPLESLLSISNKDRDIAQAKNRLYEEALKKNKIPIPEFMEADMGMADIRKDLEEIKNRIGVDENTVQILVPTQEQIQYIIDVRTKKDELEAVQCNKKLQQTVQSLERKIDDLEFKNMRLRKRIELLTGGDPEPQPVVRAEPAIVSKHYDGQKKGGASFEEIRKMIDKDFNSRD